MLALFKSNITNIKQKDIDGTFIFHTDDITLAALLRKSMFEAVTSVAISTVKFHSNPLHFHDEIIAMLLGQTVIDNTMLENEVTTVRANVRGPCVFSTKDIPLPFAYDALICQLGQGEEIDLEVTTGPGQGYSHAKWGTVCAVSFDRVDNGFKFSVELNGNLPLNNVVQQAFAYMPQVYEKASQSDYNKMLLISNNSLDLLNTLAAI